MSILAYITKTFRLRLTRLYKETFHWTTNEHWITHIYFFREVIWTWPLTECSQNLTAESNGAKVGDWSKWDWTRTVFYSR